jgi:K(+)-stimulated pyrophosphate-energized sodium pump
MHWLLHTALPRQAGRLRFFVLFSLTALLALPAVCMAAGGESVELKFSHSDLWYLAASLAFGLFAIFFAIVIMRSVLSRPEGTEKMVEVGQAIRDGALAYLRQQVRTMSVFVILLAIGLGLLYYFNYSSGQAVWLGLNARGLTLGVAVALSLIAGVAASYIAGYTGMLMAVRANTRTAFAAITSSKASLEVAFRSGAVAGLFTVGMGLIGATAILYLGGSDAMRLLVGFGFGGSLAALFMRVGGGIYTKAADVGADLVGKVQAGIPEDDPRNPGTIADNVGDNVGDCAGMAADVFESYEVTLVAAIVLGAATAALFDQATWMRLILFALMARGVGIVASVVGIFMVRGSDDIDVDPLKLIRRGFVGSALTAILLTAGLALFMMGGIGNPISSSQFKSQQDYEYEETLAIQRARDEVAKQNGVPKYKVKAEEVAKTSTAKELKLDDPERPELMQRIQRAIAIDVRSLPKPEPLTGYRVVDLDDPKNPVLNYAATKMGDIGSTGFVSVRDSVKNLRVYKLEQSISQPPPPQERGKPAPPPQPPKVQVNYYGPMDQTWADGRIEAANQQATGMKLKTLAKYPVVLYANADGDLALGVDGPVENPARLSPQQFVYYRETPETMNSLQQQQMQNTGQPVAMPPQQFAKLGFVTHQPVHWFQFVVCIVFGILMAFAIEWLTDYYVSSHKRPVQEVAEIATAGPAPMIIQGFAFGKESSVFSVFAIVLCLITPMIVFPPAMYGGYVLSFYGIALVGLGLLTTTGFILAMDTFGPISDNAQGVFEMSGAGKEHPEASKGIQRLDAAGNTTKALTKGFAIATAVVAAVALFQAFIESTHLVDSGLRLEVPEIFLGLLIGGAAPYLFSAFSINAVGRAAFQLITEVRRQFKEDPGIMEGKSRPNYARCVAIVTAAAQRELLGPGILAIALPMAVLFGFSINKSPVMIGDHMYMLSGAQALGGYLAGAILSGQLMAVLLANAGGLWDNSKKLIEDGMHGGKGTDAHKAGVVCDTVGDPFKDTAGPALNPLIKVMNLVALLLAPVAITITNQTTIILVTVLCVLALVVAFWWSKRASLASELTSVGGGKPGTEAGAA